VRGSFRDARLRVGCANYKGFIRNSQFDFDMPFSMPGAIGIRFMRPVLYPVSMWVQLVYLACCLCGFNETQYKKATQEQQNNAYCALAIIALGSMWTSGYEYEPIDDTSSTWSSLGSYKDCEDFVITFVSLANAILSGRGEFSQQHLQTNCASRGLPQHMKEIVCGVTAYIQRTFEKPCMLCGWIQTMHSREKRWVIQSIYCASRNY